MQPNFDLGCSPRCRNSIWPPACDLQGPFLCRINASEVSSYLHPSRRIKQTADTKCRANHAYASHSFSAVAFRAICQQGLCGLHWHRHHLSIDTCAYLESSNSIRQMHSSHTGRGRPAAYVDTVTAAICESGFEGNGWVWGDRIILGLIIPGVHRNSGHHHLVGLQQAKSS